MSHLASDSATTTEKVETLAEFVDRIGPRLRPGAESPLHSEAGVQLAVTDYWRETFTVKETVRAALRKWLVENDGSEDATPAAQWVMRP